MKWTKQLVHHSANLTYEANISFHFANFVLKILSSITAWHQGYSSYLYEKEFQICPDFRAWQYDVIGTRKRYFSWYDRTCITSISGIKLTLTAWEAVKATLFTVDCSQPSISSYFHSIVSSERADRIARELDERCCEQSNPPHWQWLFPFWCFRITVHRGVTGDSVIHNLSMLASFWIKFTSLCLRQVYGVFSPHLFPAFDHFGVLLL